MKIFLDTARLDEIQQAVDWGVCDGVTTNPSLHARAVTHEGDNAISYHDRILRIADIVDGPISAECVTRTTAELIEEARELAGWHPNVVVKIPIDGPGLAAIKALSEEGIRINTTLIFSLNQALLAARAGAAYVSPFVGRLDDIGENGIQLVADTVNLLDRFNLPAQVIAASLRNTDHTAEAARVGAHVATIPFPVLEQMQLHPLTDKGIQAFLDDWRQAEAQLRAQPVA
ncbi:MAG: fructose-6-phosphate aldolase [Chloroflexota bacterium]|nr:fructose-6-phosphate aldolase [Chloroflexota bacterium]